MIRTYKLAKIFFTLASLPKILIFCRFKYCHQSRLVNNRAWRYVQLNGVLQYIAPLKGNPVRDDCNIETIKDPSFITKDPYFLSLIKYCQVSIIHVNNQAWRNICNYSHLKTNEVRDDRNIETIKDP